MPAPHQKLCSSAASPRPPHPQGPHSRPRASTEPAACRLVRDERYGTREAIELLAVCLASNHARGEASCLSTWSLQGPAPHTPPRPPCLPGNSSPYVWPSVSSTGSRMGSSVMGQIGGPRAAACLGGAGWGVVGRVGGAQAGEGRASRLHEETVRGTMTRYGACGAFKCFSCPYPLASVAFHCPAGEGRASRPHAGTARRTSKEKMRSFQSLLVSVSFRRRAGQARAGRLREATQRRAPARGPLFPGRPAPCPLSPRP